MKVAIRAVDFPCFSFSKFDIYICITITELIPLLVDY